MIRRHLLSNILDVVPLQRSASSGTRLRLNGLDERGSGKERDVSALLQPTREHWHGPEDLDAAAAARADELNKTWVESPGAPL